MKKAFSLLMAFITVFTISLAGGADALALDSIAPTPLGSSNTYYAYDADTQTLTIGGTGDTPNLKDTAVSTPWYNLRLNNQIDSVIIEEGVTSLGDYFLYQVRAKSITLPSTLKKLGVYALSYTTGVTQWVLPFGFTDIGANAFDGCTTMTDISLPKTLKTIGKYAFQSCNRLTGITIPYDVTSIGSYAFYKCSKLSEVKFQSLTATVAIGSYAFAQCTALKELAVPMNASAGSYFYGFKDKKTKYADVTLHAFLDSKAHIYADNNGISCTLYDTVPMQCGVKYRNKYTETTEDAVTHFVFTADSDAVYNFYSRGDCDVTAVLRDSSGNLLGENDDISGNDRNFCISTALHHGDAVHLYVSSVKAVGDYNVQVYPDVIDSFDVRGCLSFAAGDGALRDGIRWFDITDEMLEPLVLSVHFTTGFDDMMYCETGYFDAKTLAYADTQSEAPFTCGMNEAVLTIGSVRSVFPVEVTHSYTEEVVAPTVDDDGYSVFTCVLCGASYIGNYVPTSAVRITGTAVLMEAPDGAHDNNIPYRNAVIQVDGREYPIDENGNWHVNTFDDCDIVFCNAYGEDVTVSLTVDGGGYDYGAVALKGYDYNGDGRINAKDYALCKRRLAGCYESRYWQYAYRFF